MKNRKKGFIIAFVGKNGAGKTTVSNILLERAKKENDAQSMYLGSGENYSSIVKKIYKKAEKKGNNSLIKDISGMLFYVQVAKNCARKAIKSREMAQNGTIIFWDRCPQIQFEGINDGPKIESKFGNSKHTLTKLIYPFFRKKEMFYLRNAVNIQPDIVIKLHLSVKESMRRKPDNDIDKIERKHMIVENLKFPKSKIVDIDATQPLEREIEEIYSYIEDFKSNLSVDKKRDEFIKQIQKVNGINEQKNRN